MTDVSSFLEDAAHYPGGFAAGVVFPRDAAEVAEVLASAESVLPIGAQSSVTGGATPFGEVILSTSKMAHVREETASTITVGAGMTVAAIQEHLAARGAWFPPAPTFTGACAGGIAATNAAGAATFKYGTTREWVEGLSVVLADGTILELRRRQHRARELEFALETRSGTVRVRVPGYRMPDVPKRSAGFHAAADMDLVDLFIGSEGTLGVITGVTFRVLSPAPAVALALVACASHAQAMRVATGLRDASRETWRSGDPAGIDVSAIEHMDRRSIAIALEDGVAAKHNISIPADTEVVLLVQLELPADLTTERAYEQIACALDGPVNAPLSAFGRLLAGADLVERAEIALPAERRRIEDFVALREAVPAGVNHRVGDAQRTIDPRITKTAADMIVPFDRFEEMMRAYVEAFSARHLDYAIWGHLSDANVHPNVIPRSYSDVERGREAILQLGRTVARLGGSPLAEHGVGRNPIKQALLQQLYGATGIEEMRRVKRALDPAWKLAPGVIFPRPDTR